MRPIEFRVWDKISKRMDAPDYITYDGRPGFWANESNGKLFIAKREDVVLMQFTGLLDKNGKKIFEGDVVRDYDDIQVVEWDKIKVGFVLKGGRDPILDHPDQLEVIGNIWDNPELLEVKEN